MQTIFLFLCFLSRARVPEEPQLVEADKQAGAQGLAPTLSHNATLSCSKAPVRNERG